MRLANRRPANRLNNLRPKSGHSRERLGRSPGKGDAVVMAWSEGNAAAVSRHNASLRGRQTVRAVRAETILYLGRASHGGQGTCELGEPAITRCLNKSPIVA